jgi:glycosyltransferase involved in cell wall biosynthesis
MKLKASGTQEVPDNVVPTVADECKDEACMVTVSEDVKAKFAEEAKKMFEKGGQGDGEQTIEEVVVPVVKRDSWPDQSTKDPKVTLAMMVKNEEAHIADCLESMKDHVDEIVVVDTGSTDKTVEICESYGAKVYHHKWEDSFSVARNHVISHVETPWLIQMDADEVMEADSASKVRDVVRSTHSSNENLIHLVMVNQGKDAIEATSVVNTGKIMRVIPSLHFKNRVHNKLVCPGGVRQTNLTIIHHGYDLPDQKTMTDKKNRTTRLLLMQSAEQPEDCETHHYLCIQYLRSDAWDDAIRIGEKAAGLWEKYEPYSQLRLLTIHVVAMAYYQKAALEKTFELQRPLFMTSVDWSKKALVIYPDYLDSNNLLSSIYFAIKDHKECWKYGEKYLQICDMLKQDQSKALVIPLMSLKNEWMVCLQLAINFFEDANADMAIRFVAKGEDLLPMNLKYKVSWGVFKYMLTLGDAVSVANAEAIYMTGFQPE